MGDGRTGGRTAKPRRNLVAVLQDRRGCARAHEWLNGDGDLVEWEPLADAAQYQGSKVVDALIDRSIAAQCWC